MFYSYTSRFKKNFKKLSTKEVVKYDEKMSIFIEDEYNPLLSNHKLHGEYGGFRSINITNDIRVIYKQLGKDIYLLHDIGTHNQLYS